MYIKKVSAVFFSPTDSTKNIINIMQSNLPLPIEFIDITAYSKRDINQNFDANELVIFAVPVYGGRVPSPAIDTIKKMNGSKTPTILIATYGNREYEDALLELQNTVSENGFISIAAATFITEHSIMHSVAHGRPDENDKINISTFTSQMWAKVESITEIADLKALKLKGNIPYKEYNGVPLKPHATKKCNKCGICAKNCPVNAIQLDAPNKTNKDLCISCMRCIKICPINARQLNKLMHSVAEKSFAQKCSIRKEPEIFI